MPKENNLVQPEQIEQLPAHTVDTLTEKMLALAGKVYLPENDIIRVQGIVDDVRSYPNYQYFRLKGNESRINVKCSKESKISNGDDVIVEGITSLQKSKFAVGLEVKVTGKILNVIEKTTPVQTSVYIKKERYIKFHEFLKTNNKETICAVGSAQAISRITTSKTEARNQDFISKPLQTPDRENLLSLLDSLPKATSGVLIALEDEDLGQNLWNCVQSANDILSKGLPIFLVIPNEYRMTPICSIADEIFATPEELQQFFHISDQAKQKETEIISLKEQVKRIHQLEASNKNLKNELDTLAEERVFDRQEADSLRREELSKSKHSYQYEITQLTRKMRIFQISTGILAAIFALFTFI